MGFTTCTNTTCLRNIFPRTRSMKDHASVTNHQSWYQFSFVWPSHSHFTHFSTKNTFYYCAQLDDDWMGKQSDCHSVYTKAIMTAEDWPLGVHNKISHPSLRQIIIVSGKKCFRMERPFHHVAYYREDGRHCDQSTTRRELLALNHQSCVATKTVLAFWAFLSSSADPLLGIKESRWLWLPEQLETSSLCFDRSQLCPAGNRAQTPATIRPPSPPCHHGPHRQPRHLRAGPQLHLHVQLRAGDKRRFTFLNRLSLLWNGEWGDFWVTRIRRK